MSSSKMNIFDTQNHFHLLTSCSYEKMKNSYKMLDDSTISAWSVLMNYYLSYTKTDHIILFPLDLMKYYAGISLKERKYDSIKSYTKHLNGKFSIFSNLSHQK